ncbi:unnamed protein product, partial [Brachionus calyciflorus]
KWTIALALCCFSVTLASFQFGYNISSLNSPSSIIKSFIKNETYLFENYNKKLSESKHIEETIKKLEDEYKTTKQNYKQITDDFDASQYSTDLETRNNIEKRKNETETFIQTKCQGCTIDEFFEKSAKEIADFKLQLEKLKPELIEEEKVTNKGTEFVWTILNSLFVVGGMLGAIGSKLVLDILGRKVGIIFHNFFSILASLLVYSSVYFSSPVLILISRFLFGLQGGLSCSLVPTYLAEISPDSLRGQTGVLHQLMITIGILVAQTLGFRQLLGTENLWHFLVAVPIIPALICSFSLLLFFPETPKALLLRNNDYDGAQKALQILRNTQNVKDELISMQAEMKNSGDQSESVSIAGLFKDSDLKWPLITSIVLQITQQLCGVNAIFFYSAAIFSDAGIQSEYIQYAIFTTGFVNVFVTIGCIPLIDRLGRRPLLLIPLVVMILNYILLVVFLTLKGNNVILSYLSIVCILIFIVCFAVGLGPIPFIYAAECFRQNARSSAMALCSLINWTSSFLLTLTFPFLQQLIQQYVFLIFTGIITISFLIILKKVPETKGKNVEEVLAKFRN